jgi:hypothetical protein
MSDLPAPDTEPCPAHDDEDTDPGGHAPIPPPPAAMLSQEAQSDLLVRLVCGVEDMGRDMRATRKDVRLILEEGRGHAKRLTAIEARVAKLPCQCGDGCPCHPGGGAAEPQQAAE